MKRFIALSVATVCIVLVVAWKWNIDLSKQLTTVGTFGITMGMICLAGVGLLLHWAFKK
jgi:hypothetical protein